MNKTIYANELGKCYAKNKKGNLRLYKDGNLFRLYLVGREMLWKGDEFLGYSNRLEAIPTDIHLRDLELFEMACYEHETEMYSSVLWSII